MVFDYLEGEAADDPKTKGKILDHIIYRRNGDLVGIYKKLSDV